jgi:1-deoxy-D-xylulose-5-phosphate synthase
VKTDKTGETAASAPVLPRISSPADVALLAPADLPRLAAECRELVLAVTARNGGHLASNLGVVELTIALHHAFPGSDNPMVWDVGHQAYTHKLLTGRAARFDTLRRRDGLSGFPKRAESPYDSFDTGHSGTSISAALGIARAMKAGGGRGRAIAVIGDGSMTSGEAWEGLNHAGMMKEDIIVVLNDNEMSISPNVGAMSAYLSKLFTSEFVIRMKKETQKRLTRFPQLLEGARHAEEAVKSLVYPGMVFEELGFEYIGPVDGHRFDRLLEALRSAGNVRGPVLLHVRTVKGKGYPPAERDPASFHGVGPFDLASGKPLASGGPLSWTRAFSQALVEAGKADPRIVAVTAAMPEGTGLDAFARQFPARFYDVGIAEQHAVTFAAGMATRGARPVVAIYSTFLQRAYDQVLHDVCLQGLPVVFALDRAGLVGEDGPTHHGAFDISYLRHLPGITLFAPRDERAVASALASALALGAPAALRYPRGAGVGAPERPTAVYPPGRGEVLREGNDAVLVPVGHMCEAALAAAEILHSDGIAAAVVDPRTVKPIDEELLAERARDTGALVTIEENALAGGFGGAVLEAFNRRGVEARVVRLGLPDQFTGQATQAELRASLGLDAAGIALAVRRALGR